MLLGLDAVVLEVLIRRQLGQLCLAVLVALPHLVETVERKYRAVRPEDVIAALDLGLRLVVDRGRHAAGDETAPDELVELELVRAQVFADRVRRAVDVRRPDRLVGVLGAWACLPGSGTADVLLDALLIDEAFHFP